MKKKQTDSQSDLPDDILLHISSFLPIKDILRLRVLSTRFNNKTLCSSIPSFCFSDNRPHNCSCEHVFDFIIKTVLQNRPHTLGINRISFSSLCDNPRHGQLYRRWIIQLFLAFDIHELSLDYKLPSFFRILPSFAEFESLKVLKISMNQFNTAVKLPKMKLASLETLHIKCIRADASFPKWISESFPSLKHLFLQNLNNWESERDLIIESSSLEYLAIHDCSCFHSVRLITQNLHTLNCYFVNTAWCKLQCSARNLQSLTWVHTYRNRLHHDEDVFQNLQITTVPRLLIMGVSNYCMLFRLLDIIRSARELHLDTEVLKPWNIILGYEDVETCVKKLRHLEIHVQKCIDGENYIDFLERSSNLETLTLVDCQNDGSDDDSNPFLKERSVVDNFEEALRRCGEDEVKRTKGLKKVKLITKEFNYIVVIVIGWLMKSCEDLEEISLNYPYCFHRFMMRDGLQYLQSFQRASHQPPSFYFLPNNSASVTHHDLVLQPRLLRKRKRSVSIM